MEELEEKKGNPLMIAIGFVFVFMGGFIGILWGAHYTNSKYEKQTRIIGWVMMIIGSIMTKVWSKMMFK
jgi:cytochrome c biogenesis protein CcdA